MKGQGVNALICINYVKLTKPFIEPSNIAIKNVKNVAFYGVAILCRPVGLAFDYRSGASLRSFDLKTNACP